MSEFEYLDVTNGEETITFDTVDEVEEIKKVIFEESQSAENELKKLSVDDEAVLEQRQVFENEKKEFYEKNDKELNIELSKLQNELEFITKEIAEQTDLIKENERHKEMTNDGKEMLDCYVEKVKRKNKRILKREKNEKSLWASYEKEAKANAKAEEELAKDVEKLEKEYKEFVDFENLCDEIGKRV